MEKWVEVIGLALFVNWLLHWFTPIQSWREHLVEKSVRVLIKIRAFWAEPLLLVLSCVKCLSFWAALLYFQNFTFALITSFVAVVMEKILKYENNVE